MRFLTPHYIENHILGQTVVFHAVVLEFMDAALEFIGLVIVADNFYHRASCSHAEFGEKVAEESYICIVDSIEAYRVSMFYYDDSFYHVIYHFGSSRISIVTI